jgi:hypothetical protein
VPQLVQTLQRLPTETVATQQELEQLTSHELKERLVATGSSCAGCLERQELIEALLQAGGSSGSSCCICCEDYASGDVVRVLPCKVSSGGSGIGPVPGCAAAVAQVLGQYSTVWGHFLSVLMRG